MNSFENPPKPKTEEEPKNEVGLDTVGLEEKTEEETSPLEQLETEQINESQERSEAKEEGRERRGELAKNIFTSEIVSNGLDVLPFAGSGKMIVESVYGSTLSGKELSGKDRIIHGAIGAGMLALEFTGIGAAGRALSMSGRSLSLIEKIGATLAEKGITKGAAIFVKTGAFMARHPQLVARAEKYADTKIREHISQFGTN